LLAGLLHKAGADFGNSANFYPADEWNPDGYFEQHNILRLNMKLLHGPWGRLSYLNMPSPKTILSRGRHMNEALREASKGIGNQIVKENRFCITLPAWQQSGLKVDKVIVCLRHPWDVVRSLKKRNHLPFVIGFKLWHEHLLRILKASEGINRKLFLYESIITDKSSLTEFTAALNFIGIYQEEQTTDLLLKGYLRKPNFIKKRYAQLPQYVEALWNQLLEEHKKQSVLAL
jgi:hypothetical protein